MVLRNIKSQTYVNIFVLAALVFMAFINTDKVFSMHTVWGRLTYTDPNGNIIGVNGVDIKARTWHWEGGDNCGTDHATGNCHQVYDYISTTTHSSYGTLCNIDAPPCSPSTPPDQCPKGTTVDVYGDGYYCFILSCGDPDWYIIPGMYVSGNYPVMALNDKPNFSGKFLSLFNEPVYAQSPGTKIIPPSNEVAPGYIPNYGSTTINLFFASPTPTPTKVPCGGPCTPGSVNQCDLQCPICTSDGKCAAPSPTPTLVPCGGPCTNSTQCDKQCPVCTSDGKCAAPTATPTPTKVPCGGPCQNSTQCDQQCPICTSNGTCAAPSPTPTPTLVPCGGPCQNSQQCDQTCPICTSNGTCGKVQCGGPCTNSNQCDQQCPICSNNGTCGKVPCGGPCSSSIQCDQQCPVCTASGTCAKPSPTPNPTIWFNFGGPNGQAVGTIPPYQSPTPDPFKAQSIQPTSAPTSIIPQGKENTVLPFYMAIPNFFGVKLGIITTPNP